MRPLNLVIEAMRKVIKANEHKNKSELLTILRTIEEKCNLEDVFKNNVLWGETNAALTKYLDNVDNDWKNEVADIFLGRIDYITYL